MNRIMSAKFIILYIAAIIFCTGCSGAGTKRPRQVTKVSVNVPFVRGGEIAIYDSLQSEVYRGEIEVADTPEEQAQGLMYRDSMKDSQGMLFLFDREEPLSFWMKNTRLPLDIIFIDNDKRVVSIAKNCKPYSLDPRESEKPARYVLELNGGLCERVGIVPGCRVEWKLD